MSDLTPEALDELEAEYPLNPELDDYGLWDREAHLGPPPWKRSDKLAAWETAHGHDVRMKCYPEFDCRLVEETHARKVRALVERIRELEAERDQARAKLEAVRALIGTGYAVTRSAENGGGVAIVIEESALESALDGEQP